MAVNHTVFPATPRDVAILTVQEFTFDLDELDSHRAPSLGRVCRTFMDDANRAVVWWIRFGALRNWYATTDGTGGSTCDAWLLRAACETAASFPLDDRWEFDREGFELAVEALAAKRAGPGADR